MKFYVDTFDWLPHIKISIKISHLKRNTFSSLCGLCTSLSQFIYLLWFIIEIIGHIWKCSSNQIISIGVSKKIYCKSTMKYNEVNANKFCSLTVWTHIYVYWRDFEDNNSNNKKNVTVLLSNISFTFYIFQSWNWASLNLPS